LPELQQKYPPRPQVPPPKLLLDVRKLCHQVVRGLPFQPLQQSADRHLRRNRNKQMDMVLGNVPLQNLHLMLRAYLPDQIPHPRRHLANQRRSPVLRYPHQMQMDLENRMRPVSVFCHSPSLIPSTLKPSPKGEGFNPPRRGQ